MTIVKKDGSGAAILVEEDRLTDAVRIAVDLAEKAKWTDASSTS